VAEERLKIRIIRGQPINLERITQLQGAQEPGFAFFQQTELTSIAREIVTDQPFFWKAIRGGQERFPGFPGPFELVQAIRAVDRAKGAFWNSAAQGCGQLESFGPALLFLGNLAF
jgi:hypothetical protein